MRFHSRFIICLNANKFTRRSPLPLYIYIYTYIYTHKHSSLCANHRNGSQVANANMSKLKQNADTNSFSCALCAHFKRGPVYNVTLLRVFLKRRRPSFKNAVRPTSTRVSQPDWDVFLQSRFSPTHLLNNATPAFWQVARCKIKQTCMCQSTQCT